MCLGQYLVGEKLCVKIKEECVFESDQVPVPSQGLMVLQQTCPDQSSLAPYLSCRHLGPGKTESEEETSRSRGVGLHCRHGCLADSLDHGSCTLSLPVPRTASTQQREAGPVFRLNHLIYLLHTVSRTKTDVKEEPKFSRHV